MSFRHWAFIWVQMPGAIHLLMREGIKRSVLLGNASSLHRI